MADGLSMRDLEKVIPVGGPVNWRTTKNKTETRNFGKGPNRWLLQRQDFLRLNEMK